MRKLAVAAVTMAAVAAPLVAVSAKASPAEVVLSWQVTNDWVGGFQVSANLTNTTGEPINAWQVSVAWPHQVTSAWDTTWSQQAGSAAFGAPAWNPSLAPGASASFGLIATSLTPGTRVPTSCTVVGFACRITSTTTPSPEPTPTTPPAPTPSSTPTPSPTQSNPSGAFLVELRTTSSWDSGSTVEATVTNTGTTPVTEWNVDVPIDGTVTSTWNAVSASTAGHLIAHNASWNGALAPGASTAFGFTLSATASSHAPAPTASPIPTISTPTPVPTSIPGSITSGYAVAPYVDMLQYPTPDLKTSRAQSGVGAYTLAFITDGGSCTPAWGGAVPLSTSNAAQIDARDAIERSIDALEAAGGSTIMSFGGANGTELAQACTTLSDLTRSYRQVIERYTTTHIDFDIEGGALADRAANLRRGQAIAALQAAAKANGSTLTVSLTLPVFPTGLTQDGLNAITDTIAGGARVDLVNVMAMDYGPWAMPNPDGNLGQAAIDAGVNTAAQMARFWPTLTPAQRLAHVGVTPMIGRNDVATEFFRTQDAHTVGVFARAENLGRLSWWSVNRDKPCPAGQGAWASSTCSGDPSPAWTYAQGFLGRI